MIICSKNYFVMTAANRFIWVTFCLIGCFSACMEGPYHQQNKKLELVFSDSIYQLTGVAKQGGGKLLVNYPKWSDIYKYAVTEVVSATQNKPYPDEPTNTGTEHGDESKKWICVQSVYVDDNNAIWVLDPAAPKLKTIVDGGPKLVKMGNGGNFEKIYYFKSIVPDTAYLNDVRIDVKTQYAYITESKGGGIIVLNLATGNMRRLLSDHYSVKSDPSFIFEIDGRELMKDGKPAKFNSDGIALTPDGQWLYYKPLSDDKLYRINTAALRDAALSPQQLASQVEDLGHFTTTDGMIFDKSGNLYLGDLQRYRIVRIDKDLKMTTVIQDDRLIWPDSYSIEGDSLYISCSQIQKQPEYNNGVNMRVSPYTVYKINIR